MKKVQKFRILVVGATLTTVLVGTGSAIAVSNVNGIGSLSDAAPHRPVTPIKHVIEIMLENHSFDSLFGNFPGGDRHLRFQLVDQSTCRADPMGAN